MSRYYRSFLEESGPSYTARTTAFASATGITDLTILNALNTFDLGLISNGLDTKMKALYPFVGGTATTHKFNFMDARDLDAAFRLTFSGGFSHTSLGVVPNGTNTFANPYFLGTNFTSVNNAHISFYSQTSTELNSNSVDLGCFESVNAEVGFNIRRPNNACVSVLFNETYFINTTNTDAKGMYIASRNANNSFKLFKNNTTLGFTTGINSSSFLPNKNIYLFTSGDLNNNASSLYSNNKTSSFISIGDGLTDTEASNYYTLIQAFQTSLSRQV